MKRSHIGAHLNARGSSMTSMRGRFVAVWPSSRPARIIPGATPSKGPPAEAKAVFGRALLFRLAFSEFRQSCPRANSSFTSPGFSINDPQR